MASLYTPQLTRCRVATDGGVVRDCVDHEGKLLVVRREDCRRRFFFRGDNNNDDDDDAQQRECIRIDGEVFPLMEEKTVAAPGAGGNNAAVRCVEYVEDDGSALLLTVTVKGEGKEQKQKVAVVDARSGEVRVLGCSGSYYDSGYYDRDTGTVQHVVEVQVQVQGGGRESYMLLVSVRKELARIVRIKRLN
uniref:Uncharacterized protein n=1 Tax=Leersia perrieri TaxID=77586 RepID=A0A0D9V2V6_9ORYZ